MRTEEQEIASYDDLDDSILTSRLALEDEAEASFDVGVEIATQEQEDGGKWVDVDMGKAGKCQVYVTYFRSKDNLAKFQEIERRYRLKNRIKLTAELKTAQRHEVNAIAIVGRLLKNWRGITIKSEARREEMRQKGLSVDADGNVPFTIENGFWMMMNVRAFSDEIMSMTTERETFSESELEEAKKS